MKPYKQTAYDWAGTVLCNYCGNPAQITLGRYIWPHRTEMHDKRFFICVGCDAWVGTHEKTGKPFGTLANFELRLWRHKAHRAFDPIWEAKVAAGIERHNARNRGYKWLARQLGINKDQCHIANMDIETCKRVVELCESMETLANESV